MELEKLEDAYLTFEIDLALKIESSDFEYPRFSGYYISNFPGTYDSKKV